MIFPKAKKIAKELNWYKTEKGVFGLYKNYFFNIYDASLVSNPQYKFITARIDNSTEEQKNQIKAEIEIEKKNLKYTNFKIENNSIYFEFAENLTYTKLKTVYNLLDFIADLFQKLGLPEQNRCQLSGDKENIKYYDLNNTGIILNEINYRQIRDSFDKEEKQRLFEEKNYLVGFLGSILFSIPGIIVWILIAVYLDRLASGVAVIIAFLGLKGYEYFKGRQGKLTKYLIVFSNIISILIANILTIIALLMNEGLKIDQAIIEFQSNEFAQDMFKQNTLISFILAFFVWIWLLFILKDKKMKIIIAEKMGK